LCERFTTSKIEKFGDLKKVASFGFRGEALASISFVSHLTVTSKTPKSELAYSATFQNGLMVKNEGEDAPRPCAGHKGTVIQVRDLFYNATQRRRSMGTNDEYQKIVDVVSKYSIHYPMIKFTCKRVEDKKTDVSTHAIQRPNLDKIEDQAEFLHKINEVRIEIIKR
jgi:DNA mismatch repair protein MLH1